MTAAYREGYGASHTYPLGAAQAYDVALRVLRWHDPEAVEEHRGEGRPLATFGTSAVSWASYAGVWVVAESGDASKVTVMCKRKVATNAATRLTEHTFHREFERAVEMVKAGKALPDKNPE